MRYPCLKNESFKRFDSVFSKNDTHNGAEYFIDPKFQSNVLAKICQNIGGLNRFTYFEIKSLFSEERSGIIYLPASNRFYSFTQKEHNSALIFQEGLSAKSALYNLALKYKNVFNSNADTLKSIYGNRGIMDAPLLRVIDVNETSASMFVIPYVPRDFM